VEGDVYAAHLVASLHAADRGSERARQSTDGRIGPSDLVCRERARRVMTRATRTDSPKGLHALMGTYVHRGIQGARSELDVQHEVEVSIRLPSGFVMTGHADEVDTVENSVTDFKTVNDLAYRQRIGVDEGHLRQVHLYALGLMQCGVLADQPLVRVVYVDRGGADGVMVHQQQFDPSWVVSADEFVTDVVYAIRHREEASRDWPGPMCARFCPFFTGCRPDWAGDVSIVNGELLEAVNVYVAAQSEEKQARLVKEQAREKLRGVNGSTPDGHTVRWTVVNKDSGSYERLDVT